jgi:hypothetical protein
MIIWQILGGVVKIKVGRDYCVNMNDSNNCFYIKVVTIEDDFITYNNYLGMNSRDKLDNVIYKAEMDEKAYKILIPMVKEVKNTKLARKMYPDHTVEGDFLVVEV